MSDWLVIGTVLVWVFGFGWWVGVREGIERARQECTEKHPINGAA